MLERHCGRSGRVTIRQTGKIEHLLDVRDILLADACGLFVLVQVVLPIRQADSRLRGINHISVRILEIGILAEPERHVVAENIGSREIDSEFVDTRNRIDSVELRLQRFDAACVTRVVVHERLEQVADFLLVAAVREIAGGRFLDDRPDAFLRLVGKNGKCAVRSLVRRDLILFHPDTVHPGEKVLARADGLVHVLVDDAGIELFFGWRGIGNFRGRFGTTARQRRDERSARQVFVHFHYPLVRRPANPSAAL